MSSWYLKLENWDLQPIKYQVIIQYEIRAYRLIPEHAVQDC